MADIYIDSTAEVLKINGKCYVKATGDLGYQTHTTDVIQDSFSTSCKDCQITITVNPGEAAILRRDTEFLRFKGSNPGDTALIVLDDGANIFNIEIANIGGQLVFDHHNTNGIQHTFTSLPETYTFVLAGITHTIKLAKLGSFFLDFRFNVNDDRLPTPYVDDANRNGTKDVNDAYPYDENVAVRVGFNLDDIPSDFGNSSYIQIGFKDVYVFRTSTPAASRDSALQELESKVNAQTQLTGLRAEYDPFDGTFKAWFAPNSNIAPTLTAVYSIASINGGFETLIKPIINYRDSDNDGIIDALDCDPLNIGTRSPAKFLVSDVPSSFPIHSDQYLQLCVGGGRIPPKRCYAPDSTIYRSREEAFAELAEHLAEDLALGVCGFSGQLDDNGNLLIIDPVSGNPPSDLSLDVVTSGIPSPITPSTANDTAVQPYGITLGGSHDYYLGAGAGGVPQGGATNYLFAHTGDSYNDQPVYIDDNLGLYLFFDGSLWVVSVDNKGIGSNNYRKNDTSDIYDTIDGSGAGLLGQITFTVGPTTLVATGTPNQATGNYTIQEHAELAETKTIKFNDFFDANTGSLKFIGSTASGTLDLFFYDSKQPCVDKEGFYRSISIGPGAAANEIVFDVDNKYGANQTVTSGSTVAIASLLGSSNDDYSGQSAISITLYR